MGRVVLRALLFLPRLRPSSVPASLCLPLRVKSLSMGGSVSACLNRPGLPPCVKSLPAGVGALCVSIAMAFLRV